MIRSCFFKRRFPATRALTPPGLSSLAIVARMWAKTRNRFIMAGELRRADTQEQGVERPEFQLKLAIRHAQVQCTKLYGKFRMKAIVYTPPVN